MKRNLKKFLALANIINLVKKVLFYEIAAVIGIIVALKFFFPSDFVILKTNEAMLKTDYSIKASEVYYSVLKSVGFDNFYLTEKGKKLVGVQNVVVTPSLATILGLSKSVDFALTDFNNSGGDVEGNIDIDRSSACVDVDVEELSFLLLKMLLPDMVGKGTLSGSIAFCKSKKLNGEIDIIGKKLVFGGKIKGFTVKSLKLGSLTLQVTIKDNKLTIKKAEISGDLKINVTGKINLNSSRLNFSRPDLVVTITEKKEGTITSLSPFDIALAQFKDEKVKKNITYRFSVKGLFTKPSIRKERSK